MAPPRKTYERSIAMEVNDLLVLLEMYPNEEWDFEALSYNPNITWEFIRDHPQMKWDYNLLSRNPNITWEIIKDNPHPPCGEWNYIVALANPTLVTCKENINDYIFKHISTNFSESSSCFAYVGLYLSQNPNVDWDYVLCNPRIEWYYHYLAKNAKFTWNIVKSNPIFWKYDSLNTNPNITWEIIKDNPQIKWQYYIFSSNPNITLSVIKANPHAKWDDYWLLRNPSLSWEELQVICNKLKGSHPHKAMLWENPNITWQIVKADRDFSRDGMFYRLSSNLFLKDRRSLRFTTELRNFKEFLGMVLRECLIRDIRNIIVDYIW